MGDERRGRPVPSRAWLVIGGAVAVLGVVVLVTPLRVVRSPEGVPLAALAGGTVVLGAWFVVYAFLARPRSNAAVPLDPEESGMPRDPAIYDPADYEPRPGFVTEVDGRRNVTTVTSVVVTVAAGFALVVSGALQLDRWVAYPVAVAFAVVVAQVWSLVGRQGSNGRSPRSGRSRT